MIRIFIFSLLMFFSVCAANAQSNTQLGVLPSLSITKKLPRDWSLNFKAESRQALYQDDYNYNYLLTDLGIMAGTKIRLNTSMAIGYLMRIEEDNVKNRSIQQISFVRRHTAFLLSHRISADQTFSKQEDAEFRFRYRLSSEMPLQGQSLDPGEFFLKLSNEYLNSFQGAAYDLEIRGAAFIGYRLNLDSKLELGIDYRADSFVDANTRNRIWMAWNFYYSFSNS